MLLPLPSSLSASIEAGLVLEHGRLQPLNNQGAVLPDASLRNVQPEFQPALDAARAEWLALPAVVPSLSLIAVYARGSLPRGLGLWGVSDIDTLGVATIGADAGPALQAWRAQSKDRAASLREAFPSCSGLEMALLAVPESTQLGQWLRGETEGALDDGQLRALDAFRLSSQGALLYGQDLVPRLPPPVPQPRLALALRSDVARATRAVRANAAAGRADDALEVARWAAKRALRAGMELSSPRYGSFSRDLLPCHRAIRAVWGEPAGARSLTVLQLACLPPDHVTSFGGAGVVAEETLAAVEGLHECVEGIWCDNCFREPLTSFAQLPKTPPLPPAALARAEATVAATASTDAAARTLVGRWQWQSRWQSAAAVAVASFKRRALVSRLPWAAAGGRHALREEREAARLVSDPLPKLTLEPSNRPHHRRVLDLDWAAAVGAGGSGRERARVERIARRALASGSRPVVLRGMASELAPVGSHLWHLDALPTLVPTGRVRVSPDQIFRFCREGHPLCTNGAFPLPSRVVNAMSGREFVRRISRPTGDGTAPANAIFYAEAAERYYLQADLSVDVHVHICMLMYICMPMCMYMLMCRYYLQADLSADVLDKRRVPAMWRSILGSSAQAQPLRLWVSTHGATTPLHFDAAHSFLAQMRGAKRLTFFAPAALPGLYPYPADHPLHRRGRVNLYADERERDEIFPRFLWDAAPAAQTIDLREGDVVLFPRYWWHHIETTSSLSCSVGCRYV